MLNLKNCLKRKLVAFYRVKLSRFRFYNKYTNKIKKISNFFNVFFLGFIKISLLKTFFSYQIEVLIKNNFFIFKYLKSFITAKIPKKKYFFNNLLKSGRGTRCRLAFKRYYFLIRLSRRGKFSKLNVIKSKQQQLRFQKGKKINRKDLYLIFGDYLKNGRTYVVKKKKPIIIIKPFYKNFFTNFNAKKKSNTVVLKSKQKKKKKNLTMRFKKNIIKLKLKKKIRKKRILINNKFKMIRHLKKLLFLKKKIFINKTMAGRFSFFFLNARNEFVARRKKKRRKRLVRKKSRFITTKKCLKYFFRKKKNYARIFFPSFLTRRYKKQTWKKRNIYLISFLKRKIRILRKNLRKKKLRKDFKKLLKKKFSSKNKKKFIFKKKNKKPKKYSFSKKKTKKKIYYYRRYRLRRFRRFRRNFYYNNRLKKKLINSRIKKYYFIISRWRTNKKNKKFYKTIFFKNLQLEQKSFLKNKLNFVNYNYFLSNFGNSFFFRIKFLKFFNFNIRFLSAMNKRFLKKNLSFFTENSRKKKKHLIEKFFGFNAKIYKINNFDKFKFLKVTFQKNKKLFYIFDSSNFFQSKNNNITATNNSGQIFSMKSTFNKFFYSFLNNTQLIKNQLSPCFFYDFFCIICLTLNFFLD